MSKKMNALSFWQPYAWLIANGLADFDSRTWKPSEKYLGQRFAIHASNRQLTREGYEEFLQIVKDRGIKHFPQSPKEFDYGAVVGTVVLEKVVDNAKSYWAAPEHFHWKLSDAKRLRPIPTKGRRSWFTING